MLDELQNIIFLDIETVPCYSCVDEYPPALKELLCATKKKKAKKKSDEDEKDESGYEKAGLYAEYGKIVCISLGRFTDGLEDHHIKIHSLSGDNEKELLQKLSDVLNKYPNARLCAHNGKGFDFPFLGRRYLINGISLPSHLKLQNKKPWEVPHIDTMEFWSFGARNSSVALKLLCAVFGIDTPKDDIDGSDVARVYYQEKDLPRIVKYCEKDVFALARVYKRMVGVI